MIKMNKNGYNENWIDDYGKAAVITGSILGALFELTTRILGHIVELRELSNENPKIKNLLWPEIEKVEEKVRKVRVVARNRDAVTKGEKRNGVYVDTEPPKDRRRRRNQ